MSKILKEIVQSVGQLAPGMFKMTINSEYISQNAVPGQFVNIKCSDGINVLLRRPISICNVDRVNNTFDIVFQVKGAGTGYLSQKKAGNELDLIGPLGNGFDISDEYKKIAVVGGGIGIFPLMFLLSKKKCAEKSAFLGFRSANHAVLTSEFRDVSDKLFISTDDGSLGYKGLITDLLEEELNGNKGNKYDIIYTCGPVPMIKKVVDIAGRNNIKCQVCLEQRMGCGIGACLVCACKTRLGDEWQYSHVCKDGPVFWSEEVVFE